MNHKKGKVSQLKEIPLKEMTMEDVKRIYRAECLANNGQVKKGSFAARAMKAVMKREAKDE